MYVTEASLRVLRCSLCEESLSVFPISVIVNETTKTTKNICGRCPIFEEKNAVSTRNIIYEAVAEQILFPCRYKSIGCQERLVPAKLSSHEKFCAQRPIFCPHTPLGSCAWQGNKLELMEHFNDKHRFLVIENCVTEVDIVTKQEENYLMLYEHDLYIVQFKCDGDDDELKVNLCIIGAENNRNRFQYYLSFYHTPRDLKVETEKKIVELFDIGQPELSLSNSVSTCIVQISNLLLCLNNPSTIRCHIFIKPSDIIAMTDSDGAAGGDSSLLDGTDDSSVISNGLSSIQMNEELQRKLECPVCLAHFKVPVLQCVQGHSLCEACRPESGNCPECRSDFAVTRNFTLEKILEVTSFNCKNDEIGCRFVGIPADLAIHEPNCPYCRNCPLIRQNDGHACVWMGSLFDILQHCRTDHSDNILDLDLIMYYFPDPGEIEQTTFILNRYEQLFTMHFYCDEAANCFWRVQWMGTALSGNGAAQTSYSYEVSIVSENSHKISIQKPIAAYVPRDAIFGDEDDDYIMIPKCQLRPFCIMDALEYFINIFPS